MEIFLRGEDLFHTISNDLSAPITTKSAYKAIYWITLCLGEDDEELVSERGTAKEVWEELKRKYADSKASGRKLLRSYFNFQMTGDMDINRAWTHLLALGKKIKAAQPKFSPALDPEARVQVLLSGLPDHWASIRDAIDGQPHLSPDSILSILQEKEVDMPSTNPALTAFAAQATSSRGSSQGGFRGRRSESRPTTQRGLRCHLCERKGHSLLQCPYLDIAKNMVQVLAESKLVSDTKAMVMVAQEDDDWGYEGD